MFCFGCAPERGLGLADALAAGGRLSCMELRSSLSGACAAPQPEVNAQV